MQDDELAAFQGRMLELLHAKIDPDLIRKTLLDEFPEGVYHDFLSQMEPRMIEVAAELVKKWGLRSH